MTLKGRDGYRDDQWLSPEAERRASPECSEKPCSPSTTELLPHPPTMLHLKQRGLWMFSGQPLLVCAAWISSASEFSSHKTGLILPCTLLCHVLDFLVFKCLGRSGSKSSRTSLLGDVPFEPTTKMQ